MDEQEFSALYAALQQPLFAWASSRLAPQEARDVVHDAFEVVWMKRNRAPREPEELRRWCYGIVRNKIRQELQRRTRKHHDGRFAEDHAGAPGPVAGDVADDVVERIRAREVVASLTPRERELLALVLGSDATTAELSRMLGASYSATTTRMSRLRQRLVALMQAEPDPEQEVGAP